jgi:hypothetical protein
VRPIKDARQRFKRTAKAAFAAVEGPSLIDSRGPGSSFAWPFFVARTTRARQQCRSHTDMIRIDGEATELSDTRGATGTGVDGPAAAAPVGRRHTRRAAQCLAAGLAHLRATGPSLSRRQAGPPLRCRTHLLAAGPPLPRRARRRHHPSIRSPPVVVLRLHSGATAMAGEGPKRRWVPADGVRQRGGVTGGRAPPPLV